MEDDRTIPVIPYTPGKRYPNMTGDIGGYRGWPLPSPTTQIIAAILAVGVLYVTRGAWARFGMQRLVIYPAFVAAAYYAARRVRPEGRTPGEAVLGFFCYLFATHRLQGKWFRFGFAKRRSHMETFKGGRIALVSAEYRKPARPRHALRWSR